VIQSNTLFGGFSVNGSRERSNNFLLDGTTTTTLILVDSREG